LKSIIPGWFVELLPALGMITPRYVHGPVGLALVEYAICSGKLAAKIR